MKVMKNKALSVLLIGAMGMTTLVGCSKGESKVSQDTTKITLVLDEGGVNDQSFNQSAWEGALEAQKEYGVEVSYLESHQESDYMQNIETAIDNESDIIIGVGFKITDAIGEAAEAYPEQKFAIVDGAYDKIPENLQPILFNEEQAGYCVGLIAAKMTKANVVGFIGGMDVPSCSNFFVGFEKAIKEENPSITVLSQYANSFTDAAKGKAIAQQMINQKADIIFTAGGGVNTGVYESIKESKLKAIGVDMPSNHIAPNNIISSALKNVGTGVKLTIKDVIDGKFVGGQVKMFDLSNNGVGFEKTNLLPEEVVNYVESKINK